MYSVMRVAANAIRGCIVAPKGRKLVVSDLSNIEGRVAAWLAGEHWKLEAFAAFDAGEGADLYRVAYGRAFAVDPGQVEKDQRQIGKVMELMLQYEGGVGAFITGAATYGIDLEDMAERAWPSIPRWARDEATEFLEWCREEKRPTYGLSAKVFIVCDALKRMWRKQHQRIAAVWVDLKSAAINAVEWPGQTFRAGMFKARRDGAWLRILLPSGNYLCYPSPEVRKGALTYMGVNQYTRKWSRLGTYGGKLFENACQSLARDVMAANMPAIEEAGYDIVLSVHDELITEADDTPAYSSDALSALLSTNPPWAVGMPLAAGGFEAYRYRKD
jgi:DNA polymerase